MSTLLGFRLFAAFILTCLLSCTVGSLYAQQPSPTGDRVPPRDNRSLYEIHRIEFIGNSYFSDETLLGVIGTRASEKSLPRGFIEFYRKQFERNPAAPRYYINQLRRMERDIDDVREYYNREMITTDTNRLKAYYNQHGFHRTTIAVTFTYEQPTKENVLTFRIIENPPARLDTIVYIGLDGLPPHVDELIAETRTVQTGALFNQSVIVAQNERILQVLRNNGYFYANYKDPLVLYLVDQNVDSVTVFFSTGIRQRIGAIYFVDSLAGQPGVSLNMRRNQLEIHEGDWYDQSAVVESVNNLYSLGVFEIASIDTTTQRGGATDSTLALKVFTSMKEMQEIGAGLLTNKDEEEDFWNAGVELSYTHKNIFGAAQTLNPYGRVLVRDINSWIGDALALDELQLEYLAGVRFLQPYLTNVLGTRMGLSAQGEYSLRTIYAPLRLQSTDTRLSFPFALDRGTFISSFLFDLALEREEPQNFNAAYERALSQPGVDTLLVQRQLYQYAQLDTIVNQQGNFFSSFIVGGSVIGDTRNHPFTPSNGRFFSFSTEWGGPADIGGARFVRLLGLYLRFLPSGTKNVWAFKLRVGHTFWQDRENSYVPLSRHFFAGGSNSVRAFASRELRAVPIDNATTSEEVQNLADFIGSGSLFEASVEYRYKFLPPVPPSADFWTQQLSSLGVTFFADFGNSYNSFLENPDNYGIMSFETALQKIAIGTGAGIRYDTPVGPIRIDIATAVYNPMLESNRWIWERPFSVQWQFGIGHAF